MTELLYQTDSYLREFDATVVAVDAAAGRVALDRTAFYPGGGGQPCDLGTLTFADQTVQVTQVKKEGDLVWHYLAAMPSSLGDLTPRPPSLGDLTPRPPSLGDLTPRPPSLGGKGEENSPPLVGEGLGERSVGEGLGERSVGEGPGERSAGVGLRVHGALDWPRRYALMRTHTALHILCGVVWRDYGALVTGGNMDPLQGRMDFEFATLRGELVGEIEAKCNAEIAAARDVRVKILPREEAFRIPDLIRTKINLLPPGIQEVRTVEIVGLDLQADGGTHVANTREVGRIRVTDYKSKGAINKRIYIEVGDK